MKKTKKRYLVLLLVLVLALGAIGGIWAYYHSTNDAQNRLITQTSGVVLKEIFNPSDQWVPGEDKQKEVSFGNTGESDQVIRFKVIEQWYDNKGTPNNLNDDTPWNYSGTYTPLPVVINYTGEVTGGTWVKIGDYYYYTKVLAANATTPLVIDSVSFSNAISNSGPGAKDDFSNKRYSLSVQMETLDVNTVETKAGWNMNFTQSGNTLAWSTAP